MSPDSDENGRQWNVFPPASTGINCIARVATGRRDITMVQKIVEYNVNDQGLQTTLKRTAGYVQFHPEPSTKLSVQTLALTSTNSQTGDPSPYPVGSFRCEVFADNGDRNFGASALGSSTFTIDYLKCPEDGVATGEPCKDIYGPGVTGKKNSQVKDQCGVPNGGACICTDAGWDCRKAGGTPKFGGPTVITGNKDAGTTTTTTTATDGG